MAAGTPQLWMVRPDLNGLPGIRPPEGYSLRTYHPGDGRHWERIITESFNAQPGAYSFDNVMRKDPAFRAERTFFIACGEEPVATASAYYWPAVMRDAGNVHYVGALRSHQGKRLGYWVVLAALHRMRQEGRRRAWLSTDDFRLPAIKTYLNLGLQPLLIHQNQPERWRKVFAELKLPELCERFADLLAGPIWTPPVHPPDGYDYGERVARRRRWHTDRPPGRPSPGEVDAFADESLYRPSALGWAGADVHSVPAGAEQSFELWFRAGPAGLGQGAAVTFFVQGQQPLGTAVQAGDPGRPGYVELNGPDGVDLEPLCLGFRVRKGFLRESDEVRVAVGKRTGFRWTPLAGRKEFKVIVDVGSDEPAMRLPEPVVIRVIPRQADHLDVFLPPTATSGSALRATVTVRDRFDNRVPYDGQVAIEAHGEPAVTHIDDGFGHAGVGALPHEPLRVRATISAPSLTGASNWCVPSSDLNLYIGDLHCHDFLSPAEGNTADVYRWAIEDKRLDFLSVPVQAHAYLDNEKWLIAKHMAEAFLDEGRFVTFLSFEWQHSRYGDKVVHYLGGAMPCLPVDVRWYDHPAKLYEALRGTDAFVVSHHPAYALDQHVPGTDWDVMETDVDRLVEIWSMHGSSEGYDPKDRPLAPPRRDGGVMAALKGGLRSGVVAGSDSHSGRPGGSAKEPRPYWGGLCAVWAEKLTRRSLFEAFMARRTYALTGARIVLRFAVNGAAMGSEIPGCDTRRLTAEVCAQANVARVQLMRDGEVLHEETPGKDVCRVEFEDSRAGIEGASFYHCRVTQEDGHLAVCSPVWVG